MKKIIVGISGASGAAMGIRLLKALKTYGDVETHLVISDGAKLTLKAEENIDCETVETMSDYSYKQSDLGAVIASGSFITEGMIVMPCSMKSLFAIANGYDQNLLIRSASVCLKENRRVILVPRETPLSKAQIRNMLLAAENGCTILPPMLTGYGGYTTAEELIDHIVGKALMQFGLDYPNMKHWGGMGEK